MKKIFDIATFAAAVSACFLLTQSVSQANVIGTEYQNFNPSLSGTDFTTVHSSEPVKECLCNLGIFFNYAKNTLTYSDKYYQTNADLKGIRANDFLMGADIYGSFGLNKNWDVGLALPFVVTAKNDDPYGVSYFEQFGLTEVRPMTKYRFYGTDDGGLAVIASINFNTIKNNPFAGQNSNPTFNLELAADTTVMEDLKIAANLGFRKRNPGSQLIDQTTGLPVPFVPFTDSFIYSAAIAKHLQTIKSDLIAELNGSLPGGDGTDSVKTAQQALELGLGLRHQWAQAITLHGGLGTKLADAQSTPDIRAYIGLNYQFGPVCDVSSSKNVKVIPTAVISNHPIGTSDMTNLNMMVSALDPSDYAAYKWKIGPTAKTNCHEALGYSQEITGETPIMTNITNIADGEITLCAVAKNLNDQWQSYETPTIVNWLKSKAIVAIVKNHPVGISEKTDFKLTVTANTPSEFESYRWKVGPTTETDCKDENLYSKETPGKSPLVAAIGPIPDGDITLCVVAKNKTGLWQPFASPTIVNWTKKRGYELFRLNANILFDFDQDVLQKRSYTELDKINIHLKKKPYTALIVEGHTDSVGTDAYNLDLSKRRALRVMNHMIKNFSLDPNKLKIEPKGEHSPLDTNKTKEGRQNNRRVEFKVFRQ